MFCPKCRDEYRDGFTECAECGVPLVPEIPPEPVTEYVDYEEILTTFNPTDIAFIKSVLEGEGITYFFKGEYFNLMRPFIEPARLMVQNAEAGRARELLKDMDMVWSTISTRSDFDKDKGHRNK
ncbi:MAG: DUF2007 domain-containing protein [Candidatus Tritonobacter lacicola]|nr:DUF2007 domain-containing protein [Candidatus Tritonobacter lacicola]